MRILFLAPNYVGLQKPIIDEMERQGHEVVWVEDIDLPYNFRIPRAGLNKLRCRVNAYLRRPHKKFWHKILKERKDEFSKPFDLFFCINGRTLCKELFDYLQTSSQSIRKVLYVWDTQKVFDFYYYKEQFDKCLTFDFEDSQRVGGGQYLPFYWFDDSSQAKSEIKYDISIIGTDHDGRFDIVEKILPQAKAAGLSYFFKIKIFKVTLDHIFLYKLRLRFSKRIQNIVKQYDESFSKKCKSEIAMTTDIPPAQYMQIINESACILDTDRASQTGVTPRAIWALARGKKIITTNTNLLKAPFYNPMQILIIDRDNPVLDIDFIRSKESFLVSSYFDGLRIDNWVKNFTR